MDQLIKLIEAAIEADKAALEKRLRNVNEKMKRAKGTKDSARLLSEATDAISKFNKTFEKSQASLKVLKDGFKQ